MIDQLLQFGGSLAAILALFLLAGWLKLGGVGRIDGPKHAMALASEADLHFTPRDVIVDREGRAAILFDGAAVMLLMPHGNKFVGRVLGPAARVERTGEGLSVHSGERLHRPVEIALDHEEAEAWFARLRALE